MTEQEIFNIVWLAMKKQGRRSINRRSSQIPGSDCRCMYRGPGGLKCAVGCLLTDEEYDPEMEGKAVYEIELPKRLKPHARLLSLLQASHDGAFLDFWLEFSTCARAFAEEFGLTVPDERGKQT